MLLFLPMSDARLYSTSVLYPMEKVKYRPGGFDNMTVMCEENLMHVVLFRRMLPDTKEILTNLFHFPRPESANVKEFLKAIFLRQAHVQ